MNLDLNRTELEERGDRVINGYRCDEDGNALIMPISIVVRDSRRREEDVILSPTDDEKNYVISRVRSLIRLKKGCPSVSEHPSVKLLWMLEKMGLVRIPGRR
ncbi:hypothetical protein DRJ17_04660 [Candidatus Woesearchaeota archaeon]|nr:MAG: hypothetical protein DRJ17_04660 [Candidatus Woesearchaeota archaeon]